MAPVETVSAWPTVRFGVIGEAWRLYKQHWKVWSLTMLISMACVAVGGGLSRGILGVGSRGIFGGLVGMGHASPPILPLLVSMMIAGFFVGGMTRMAVNQVRGRAPRMEDLFSVTDVWFDLVLGSGLLGLLLMLGWELFVIPGLIVCGLFMFMFPLIVDGRLPATGAMIRSFEATKAQWLLATVVHLAVAAVAGLGSFLFGIGLVLTGPLYALALALLYRDLFLNPDAPEWSKPETFDEY
jgi:hypothetical protein